MWYVGIIVLICAFIYYMRSTMKDNNQSNIEYEEETPNDKNESVPDEKPIIRQRIHRPITYRDYGPMRTSRSSRRTISEKPRSNRHESNGTPRGGGIAGSRGSSSNNSTPSGGRR